MKQKLITLIMVLFAVFSLPTAHVFAVSEAGTAATLAFNQVEADDRVARLRMFLTSYDSPLAGDAETFVKEADKNGIDWKLVAAIAGVESTFGKQIPTGSYNAWGWGVFTGAADGVHFKNWADGIAQVSEGLKNNYIDRGAETLYDIGWIYAANGASWGAHTQYFIEKLAIFKPMEVKELPVSI